MLLLKILYFLFCGFVAIVGGFCLVYLIICILKELKKRGR